MMLKRRCHHADFRELLCSPACGCEPFDTVTLRFHTFANNRQRSCLARTCYTIKSNNPLASHEDFIDCGKLRLTQFWMRILYADAKDWRYQHGTLIAAFIAVLHKADDLPLQTNHLGCRVQRCCSSIRAFNLAELSIPHTLLEHLSNLAVRRLTHAAIYRCLQDAPLILHSGPLKH